MVKCSKHPKYKGIHEPRPTSKHLSGCDTCWEWYYFVNDGIQELSMTPYQYRKYGTDLQYYVKIEDGEQALELMTPIMARKVAKMLLKAAKEAEDRNE